MKLLFHNYYSILLNESKSVHVLKQIIWAFRLPKGLVASVEKQTWGIWKPGEGGLFLQDNRKPIWNAMLIALDDPELHKGKEESHCPYFEDSTSSPPPPAAAWPSSCWTHLSTALEPWNSLSCLSSALLMENTKIQFKSGSQHLILLLMKDYRILRNDHVVTFSEF